MINYEVISNGFNSGEFFLEYLPTMSLENNGCLGAEALIRWQRPYGVVMPDDFIPSIENTPLSGLVTYWVIDTVAKELGAWLKATDNVYISINVPPELLGRGGLEYAANKSGLADVKSKLILEVTERGVPDKLGVDALNAARHQGVLIALDDVGIEDSNLVVLAHCHVDIIKIDRSVIRQMESAETLNVIQGIATLMNITKLDIIAEGVESASQATALKKAGINMAQGWYFSPSLPAKDFTAFYLTHC